MKHYRTHRENWEGGFSRNEAHDQLALKANPLPSAEMSLSALKVNGHSVTYNGLMNMAFRTSSQGRLTAFNGCQCTGITVDGRKYVFAKTPVNLTFSPVGSDIHHWQLFVQAADGAQGSVSVQIPLQQEAAAATVKDGDETLQSSLHKGWITLDVAPSHQGRWLDIDVR